MVIEPQYIKINCDILLDFVNILVHFCYIQIVVLKFSLFILSISILKFVKN